MLSEKVGRPKVETCATLFDQLCFFLAENGECQCTLEELRGVMVELADSEEHIYSDKHVKDLIIKRYGSQVLCTNLPNSSCVFTFRDTADKYLTRKLHSEIDPEPKYEKLRIVTAATAIIRDVI
ncbi:hypothetical protein PR048_026314 [Dryococelus australis]|uniref:Uncharacterized protein n=1 Tax=Dryococelus australis TaxID=614101 RepID=A0ABQ9GKZ5_9NEOP|nr:hypothetical protein PR048_026314 [Dryococelus australis]